MNYYHEVKYNFFDSLDKIIRQWLSILEVPTWKWKAKDSTKVKSKCIPFIVATMIQTILIISRWHHWKIFCLWLLIFASYRKIGFHCRAVRLCLDAVVTDNLKVTVATHNLKSAELALSQVQSNPKLKSGVNFAQINGLGDHISMALSLQGCQVLKLLPCGTVDEVLPWLSRYLFFSW